MMLARSDNGRTSHGGPVLLSLPTDITAAWGKLQLSDAAARSYGFGEAIPASTYRARLFHFHAFEDACGGHGLNPRTVEAALAT